MTEPAQASVPSDPAEQDAARRTAELSALLAITRDLAGTLELEPLLDNLLAQLGAVVDFTDGSVFMREGDELVAVAYSGVVPRTVIVGQRGPLAALLPMAQLMERRQPVIYDDARFEDLIAANRLPAVRAKMPDAITPTRSWLFAPMAVKNSVIGVLVLEHVEPRRFTARQAELTQAFADHAAVAIENARLYAEGRQLAALNERQRLAAELHDSVSQAIYSISLAAHTGLANLDQRPEKARQALNQILTLAGVAFTEIRSLIYELRPESLAKYGLVTAIERQAETLRSRESVEVHLDLCPEPNIPIATKEALYRIAQESMNNIAKHARATAVFLNLSIEGAAVCLEVRDDGKGFDTSQDFTDHFGLRVMRERAEQLGGTVTITSAPRDGTSVVARLPVPSAMNKGA